MNLGANFTARLILAIVSIALEEAALYAIWRWLLPDIGVPMPLNALIIVMAVWGVYAVTNFVIVTRALRKTTIIGLPTMTGSTGRVVEPLDPEGLVRIKSELWGAESAEGEMDVGEEVTVVKQDGLKLFVSKKGTERPVEEEAVNNGEGGEQESEFTR